LTQIQGYKSLRALSNGRVNSPKSTPWVGHSTMVGADNLHFQGSKYQGLKFQGDSEPEALQPSPKSVAEAGKVTKEKPMKIRSGGAELPDFLKKDKPASKIDKAEGKEVKKDRFQWFKKKKTDASQKHETSKKGKKKKGFKAKMAAVRYKTFSLLEKGVRYPEFWARKIMNKFMERKFKGEIDVIHKDIMALDPKTTHYMQFLMMIAKVMSLPMIIETEINTESKSFQDLTESDEPTIFIFNHDHQREDPILLSIFCIRMYIDAIKKGRGDTIPRPQIIINEDILLSQSQKQREIYEKAGSIGVDADLFPSKKVSQRNGSRMRDVIKKFRNKSHHILIFPEGRMSMFSFMNLRNKFQTGVGDIVNLTASRLGRVKVVPIGFAYAKAKKGEDKKKPFGSIYVGDPIYFTEKDGAMYTSIANVTEDYGSEAYKKFFYGLEEAKKDEPEMNRRDFLFRPIRSAKGKIDKRSKEEKIPTHDIVDLEGVPSKMITDKGKLVGKKGRTAFIADIMAENLIICTKKAKEQLPIKSLGDKVKIY